MQGYIGRDICAFVSEGNVPVKKKVTVYYIIYGYVPRTCTATFRFQRRQSEVKPGITQELPSSGIQY